MGTIFSGPVQEIIASVREQMAGHDHIAVSLPFKAVVLE
jgi:hypothetical protein